jgi:hypothetical protein
MFKHIRLATGESHAIPSDLELREPEESTLEPTRRHYLTFIPWDDKYLANVEVEYQPFFQKVLPYLHARTTDVHITQCLPFVRELIAATPEPTDERVIHVAFILHDSGWSQMNEAEIADSLGVKGLALTGASVSPKEKHARLGRDVAERVLSEFEFSPPLTEAQKTMIFQAILFHDKPWELAKGGDIPINVKLVCDVDHLWSFTHENFWQDTVRKGVPPTNYLENLGNDLEGYFTTAQGKAKARQLLQARRAEVEEWHKFADPS